MYRKNNLEKVRKTNRDWARANPLSSEIKQAKIQANKQRRSAYKQRALDYKGGCYRCGSVESIVYHHFDPNEKKYNVSRLLSGKWKNTKSELDKCIPMCVGLHTRLEKEIKRFVKKLEREGYIPIK